MFCNVQSQLLARCQLSTFPQHSPQSGSKHVTDAFSRVHSIHVSGCHFWVGCQFKHMSHKRLHISLQPLAAGTAHECDVGLQTKSN